MKEWLLKTEDGKYYYHRDDMSVCPRYVEKIEIPEGAVCFTKCGLETIFWKDGGKFSWHTVNSTKWDNNIELELTTLSSYGKEYIVWERKVHQIEDGSIFIDESGIISEGVKSLDDKVNQPSHYANFSIECIDAMQAMLSRDEFIGYLRGNIFKYQWRYKLKNGVEDLKKAQWYQNKLIEVEENE